MVETNFRMCEGLTLKKSRCKNIGTHCGKCRWHAYCNNNQCTICLNNLFKPYVLACGHTFHKSCISRWLKKNHMCPLCRTPVVTKYDTNAFMFDVTFYIP